MDQPFQNHSGSGDNVGRDKHVHIYIGHESSQRSKYINAFAHFDLHDLVGREKELAAISEHLKNHNLLLLHGIGGIGKTTLAKAYISKYEEEYESIAYIEVTNSIEESMVIKFDSSLNVEFNISTNTSLKTNFERLIEILRQKTSFLLVLDNIDDSENILENKAILASLNAKIIITSRARPLTFIYEGKALEINQLNADESLKLFSKIYSLPISKNEYVLVQNILEKSFLPSKTN